MPWLPGRVVRRSVAVATGDHAELVIGTRGRTKDHQQGLQQREVDHLPPTVSHVPVVEGLAGVSWLWRDGVIYPQVNGGVLVLAA